MVFGRIDCSKAIFRSFAKGIVFILLIYPCLAQHKYENLVFEGGGVRGVAYFGALEILHKEGKLTSLKRVAGTSVGAIQATLVALSYSPSEMSDIISELNIKQFNDGQFIFIGGFRRFIYHFGWYKGDRLRDWIGDLIEQKTGNSELTFDELHLLAKNGKYKDLYITGTNLSKQLRVVFSHENYPKMKLKDAVRISISIPLYYRPAFIDSLGNVKYKPEKNKPSDVLVDGGILFNYPIQAFDSLKYIQSMPDSNSFIFNPNTLGLRLDTDSQKEFDFNNKGLAPFQITDLKSYINAFYNIIIENLNRNDLTSEDWDRTISISTKGIGPKVRRISSKNKDLLLQSGRTDAYQFLQKLNKP